MAETQKILKTLIGNWNGTCKTWFEPGQLADESQVSGEFAPILNGLYIRHRYESTIQGRSRSGEETLTFNQVTKRIESVWMDDFHMNYAFMFSSGKPTENGFEVAGHYDVAADAPPWGWRTVYQLKGDELTITAYNVSPEGEEAKAVETIYRRVSS